MTADKHSPKAKPEPVTAAGRALLGALRDRAAHAKTELGMVEAINSVEDAVALIPQIEAEAAAAPAAGLQGDPAQHEGNEDWFGEPAGKGERLVAEPPIGCYHGDPHICRRCGYEYPEWAAQPPPPDRSYFCGPDAIEPAEPPRGSKAAATVTPALDDWHDFVNLVYRLIPDGDVRGSIIGAAARLAGSDEPEGLDVERLAEAISAADVNLGVIHHGDPLGDYYQRWAAEIAAEYNRLAQDSASPSDTGV